MAERKFTDAEVIAAGEQLLAGGRKVNGWALRTTLGGGRPETLLSVWQRHHTGVPGGAIPTRPLPEEATAIIETAVAKQTKAMQDALAGALDLVAAAARKEVVLELEQARQEIARLEAEQDDASGVLEGLEADQERSQQQMDGLANELQLKDSQLGALAEENASLAERLAEAEGQAQLARDQLAESQAELSLALAQKASAEAASVEHQRSASAAEERLADTQVELREMRNRLAIARSEADSAAGQIQEMERTRAQDLEILTELRVENRALGDKLARADAGREAAERYLERVQKDSSARIAALERQLAKAASKPAPRGTGKAPRVTSPAAGE